NNTVLVTGSGSVLSNYSINVGFQGVSNKFVIIDGGAVFSGPCDVGAGGGGSGSLLVTGSGSIWNLSNSGQLRISVAGTSLSNSLVVSNGGMVADDTGLLGPGGDNTALVTGNGSVWNNRVQLTVGSNGKANTLTISNGGLVTSSNVYIGSVGGTGTNRINVS